MFEVVVIQQVASGPDTSVLGLWVYWAVIVLMMVGLYTVIARNNLVKKIMGLNIFQSAAILFFIAMGKVRGGTAPILLEDSAHGEASHGAVSQGAAEHSEALVGGQEVVGHAAAEVLYSNPLPHVLMLTAIVVGIATTALALSIVVRIQQEYGSIEEDELVALDLENPHQLVPLFFAESSVQKQGAGKPAEGQSSRRESGGAPS